MRDEGCCPSRVGEEELGLKKKRKKNEGSLMAEIEDECLLLCCLPEQQRNTTNWKINLSLESSTFVLLEKYVSEGVARRWKRTGWRSPTDDMKPNSWTGR